MGIFRKALKVIEKCGAVFNRNRVQASSWLVLAACLLVNHMFNPPKMDDLNPTPDLDVSRLSAPELQRLGVTVAQVRAVYASPVVTIEPESAFPDVWQLLGLTDKGRFIFVALRYDDNTGKLAALGVDVADNLDELRYYLCRS